MSRNRFAACQNVRFGFDADSVASLPAAAGW
jgi:hypothetical protein